jgi:hypothetical protein
MCLKAMPRVTSYSVSALPADEFPAVEWVWENPADALEALLNERFSVVFTFRGKVEIHEMNVGADYKSARPYLARSLKIRREQEYNGVIIVGDRNIRQVTRVLMPMGLDVDGKWKALKDLSYAPDKTKEDGGFGKEYTRDGGQFQTLAWSYGNSGAVGEKIAYELLPLIFRVFGGIPVGELPIMNELCDKEFDEGGIERYKSPYVVGPLANAAYVNGMAVAEIKDGVLDGYQIDHQRGIITFQEAKIKPIPGQETAQIKTDALPAHLYFTYSFEAHATKDTDVYRYGDLKAKTPLIVQKSELKLREKWPRVVYPLVEVPPDYQKEYGWQALNQADLDDYAKKVYDAYKAQDTDVSGGSITLIGLKSDLKMDGLFRSATFTVGPQGSTTEIEWGIETPKIEIPTYKERMRLRQVDKVVKNPGNALAATGATGRLFGKLFGGLGKAAGAMGKILHDAHKPPFPFWDIVPRVRIRNTHSAALPAGCPFMPTLTSPIGSDGVWNVVPVNLPTVLVPGISVTNIAPGETGIGRIPAHGVFLLNINYIQNPTLYMKLEPCPTVYAWQPWHTSTSDPLACVVVCRIFSDGGTKTAVVIVSDSPKFGV